MIMVGKIIRISGAPSPLAWFYPMVGQVSQVLEVYEPTGFIKVRLMAPVPEYDWCVQKPIERHRQVEGWLDPLFTEGVV